jgi:hypothetical protein
MQILEVIFPVVVDDFDTYPKTVAHYREALGLPLRAEFTHAGFTVSWLGPMVVLGAPDPQAIAVARQVHGILVVDDLQAFWQNLSPANEPLIAPEPVPTGHRFILRHTQGNNRVIEYLQLSTS